MSDTLTHPTAARNRTRPALKDWIRRYWDRRANDPGDDETAFARDPGLREAWRDLLTDLLGAKRKRVLDVGSGTGEFALLLDSLGHRVDGVDLSPAMVEIARGKARRLGAAARFTEGDADDLPFVERSFDAVWAAGILRALPDPFLAVRRMTRLLEPGGLLVIAESAADRRGPRASGLLLRLARAVLSPFSARARAERRVGYPGPDLLPFREGLDRDRAARILKEAGLVEVRSRDVGWLFDRARRALPWHRRFPRRRAGGYHLTFGRRP